jgi:hypothetical protein
VAAVAFAPVGSAFAASAASGGAAAQVKVAMKDCHQSAPKPAHNSGPKSGHCPDCGIDGSCNAACLIKCSQVTATVEPQKPPFRSPVRHVPVTASAEPPGWSSKPPAPPPRA